MPSYTIEAKYTQVVIVSEEGCISETVEAANKREAIKEFKRMVRAREVDLECFHTNPRDSQRARVYEMDVERED